MKKILPKLLILFSFSFSQTFLFWFIIKYYNKITNNKIKSIFITYPAEKKYKNFYLWEWSQKLFMWKIGFIGISIQDKNKITINMSTTMDESEMFNPEYFNKFQDMIHSVIKLKEYTGIEYINYAGVIPSFLKRNNLNSYQSASKEIISDVVISGIYKTLNIEDININDISCYIIGSKGFIGNCIYNKLIKINDFPVHGLDINSIVNFKKNPDKKYTLILNVARKDSFNEYLDYLDEDMILLNEVFPPPKVKDSKLRSAYHIKGIKSFIYPSIAFDYSESVPCCAIIPNRENKHEIVLKKIK
jgi:hypothetical protein